MAKKPPTTSIKALSETDLREHNQTCTLPIGDASGEYTITPCQPGGSPSRSDGCKICAYLVVKFLPQALPMEELRLHSERCSQPVHLCPLCKYYMNDLAAE